MFVHLDSVPQKKRLHLKSLTPPTDEKPAVCAGGLAGQGDSTPGTGEAGSLFLDGNGTHSTILTLLKEGRGLVWMDREGGRDRGVYFGLGERRPRRGSGSVVTGHHTQQSQTNKQDAALDAVEMFISFQMKSSAPYVLDIQYIQYNLFV